MVRNREAFGLGNRLLALFNFNVKKFFNLAAVKAHQMVVVLTFVEFVNGLARFKIAPVEQAGLLKLG